MSRLVVRAAEPSDAAACAAIYAPYVRDGACSFELEAPGAEEMAARIAAAQATHAWLVADRDQTVVGYAYAGPYRSRAAYRWTCETSVYVEAGRQRSGAGRALYVDLLERLGKRGFRTAIAVLTLPNPGSLGLHAELGFDEIGVQRNIGWKAGAWHDVALWQRPLGPGTGDGAAPDEPR